VVSGRPSEANRCCDLGRARRDGVHRIERAGERAKRHRYRERPAEFLDQVRCARILLGKIRGFRLCFELLEAGIRVEIALEPGQAPPD
jgi:hypothetical protein